MKNSNPLQQLPNGYLFDVATEEMGQALWSDQQYLSALIAFETAAQGPELKAQFKSQIIEVKQQIQQLKKACKMSGINLEPKDCKSMATLVNEAMLVLERFRDQAELDTVLICAVQKIIGFRKAVYGAGGTYLGLMDFEDAELLLDKIAMADMMFDDRLQSVAFLRLLPSSTSPGYKKDFLSTVKNFFKGG